MEQKENIFVFLCICMSWPGLWLDVPMHGFTSEISNIATIAGDRIKHVGCSIWLKTPPINIQLQNLKTWLPLKFIFNLRPRPYTIELKQPLYWAMSTHCFSWLQGKGGHLDSVDPHNDL